MHRFCFYLQMSDIKHPLLVLLFEQSFKQETKTEKHREHRNNKYSMFCTMYYTTFETNLENLNIALFQTIEAKKNFL